MEIKDGRRGTLPLSRVQQYNLAKLHLLPGWPGASICDVASAHMGLHAARLPTPYLSLWARIPRFTASDLWAALYHERRLVKLRCMRRTLHLLPLSLAPIAHQATLQLRIADLSRAWVALGAARPLAIELMEQIEAIARHNPISSDALTDSLAPALKRRGLAAKTAIHLIRLAIKEAWERGRLCYINAAPSGGQEQRLYAHTQSYYPSLDLASISVEDARCQLIYQYIARYGPVTEQDIRWWSGLGAQVVRQALAAHARDLAPVRLEGVASRCWMTAADLDHYHAFRPYPERYLCFLAHEDPALKGYYESRCRYVDPEGAARLFNPIGEARASLLLNGRVVGLWSWNRRRCAVEWELFSAPGDEERCLLPMAAERLSAFLSTGLRH